MPYTADVTALGAAAGVDGGLLALSALERSPLARVLLQGLPALGGFQAAYLGEPGNPRRTRVCSVVMLFTPPTQSLADASGNQLQPASAMQQLRKHHIILVRVVEIVCRQAAGRTPSSCNKKFHCLQASRWAMRRSRWWSRGSCCRLRRLRRRRRRPPSWTLRTGGWRPTRSWAPPSASPRRRQRCGA